LDGFTRASTNQRAVDVASFFDDIADDAGAFNLVARRVGRVFAGVSVAYDTARQAKMQTKIPVMSVGMSPVSGDMIGTDARR